MTTPLKYEDTYTDMRNVRWSPNEKAIARKAFDLALQRELEGLKSETKHRATKISGPSDLWNLEHYLNERRREIDQKYDYRYSILPEVFAVLIRERRLTLQDLESLGEDKLRFIRSYVNL